MPAIIAGFRVSFGSYQLVDGCISVMGMFAYRNSGLPKIFVQFSSSGFFVALCACYFRPSNVLYPHNFVRLFPQSYGVRMVAVFSAMVSLVGFDVNLATSTQRLFFFSSLIY